MPDSAPRNLAGGAYTAVANKDGTFDLLDVPIMAEVPKGDKGAPEDIGRNWLQASVDAAARRLASGYMAPLHVRHHETGVQTVPAGFVLPKRVEMRKYDGHPAWTMIADLKRIPPLVFAKINNLEIPYRSVEIGRWDKPEIQSLALLEDDAPYFKFELLSVGRVVESENRPVEVFQSSTAPARARIAAKEGASVLFNFTNKGAVAMADEIPETKVAPIKPEPDTTPVVKEDKGELAADGAAPEAPKDPMALLMSAMTSLAEKMDQVLMLMTGPAEEPADAGITPAEIPAKGEEKSEQEEEKKEAAPAMKAEEPAAVLKDSPITAEAKLEARLSAAELKLSEMDKSAKLLATVAKAFDELKGWPVTEDTKAKMKILAEKDPSGEALKAFTDTYKASVPKDPPANLAEMVSGAAPDPDEVLAYAAKGPELLEKARAASSLYDQAVSHRLADPGSRAKFIEIQLGANGANGR